VPNTNQKADTAIYVNISLTESVDVSIRSSALAFSTVNGRPTERTAEGLFILKLYLQVLSVYFA